jgi:hypothetical protein
VKTGAPTAPGEVTWPRYTLSNHAYLDLDDRPVAGRNLKAGAFAWADALVAGRRQQGGSWRYNIGFSAFPAPVASVDAPVPGRHAGAQ